MAVVHPCHCFSCCDECVGAENLHTHAAVLGSALHSLPLNGRRTGTVTLKTSSAVWHSQTLVATWKKTGDKKNQGLGH